MMMLQRKDWFYFILLAVIGLIVWFRFTYPQICFINIPVDRDAAVIIAKKFLRDEYQADTGTYRHAAVFKGGRGTDQFLQKSLGFQEEIRFLDKHDGELFFWQLRFFREREKEEYLVTVSAATGEVTSFAHALPDSESRPFIDETTAKTRVTEFLQQRFAFNPDDYIINNNHAQKMDKRVEYSFTWEKKGVFVRWSPEENTGGGKILISARISGDEILSFNKFKLSIPDEFNRYLSRQAEIGGNLSSLFRILYYFILTASIFFVIIRRNDLVSHTVRKFCLGIMGVFITANVIHYFNDFESLLFGYSTTQSMSSYLWSDSTNFLIDTLIVTVGILMTSLAGESLHYEVLPQNRSGSFLQSIRSSFFTRQMSKAVFLGYLAAVIMIGIQAAIFEFGQNFLGVWVEYTRLAQISAGIFPFLTALAIATISSLNEEITFRLFFISLGKKFIKNTLAVILISSIIWGFGHSGYLILPMWFRGLELTILGIYLSLIYLRYGIICVIVTHFVFNVFWETSPYIFMRSTFFDFTTAMLVLLLPLIYGVIAWVLNHATETRSMLWKLSRHQLFNLDVLTAYLHKNRDRVINDPAGTKKEILAHGWDIAVVEKAIDDLGKP